MTLTRTSCLLCRKQATNESGPGHRSGSSDLAGGPAALVLFLFRQFLVHQLAVGAEGWFVGEDYQRAFARCEPGVGVYRLAAFQAM